MSTISQTELDKMFSVGSQKGIPKDAIISKLKEKGYQLPQSAQPAITQPTIKQSPTSIFDGLAGAAKTGLTNITRDIANPFTGVMKAGEAVYKGTGDLLGGAQQTFSGDIAGGLGRIAGGAANIASAPTKIIPGMSSFNPGEGVQAGTTEALRGVGNIAGGLYNFGKGAVTNPTGTDALQGMQQTTRGLAQLVSSPFTAGIAAAPKGLQEGIGKIAQPVAQFTEQKVNDAIKAVGGNPLSKESQALKQMLMDTSTIIPTLSGLKNIKGISSTATKLGGDLKKGATQVKGGFADLKKSSGLSNLAKDIKSFPSDMKNMKVDTSKLPQFNLKNPLKNTAPINSIDDAIARGKKVGLDERDIRNLYTASSEVKDMFKKQINIAESAKSGTGRVATIQPKEVVGKKFVEAASTLNNRNKSFVKAKEQLITGLGKKQFDLKPARENLMKKFTKERININQNTGKLNFSSSVFKKDKPSQKLIQDMYYEVAKKTSLSAADIDTLKKAYYKNIEKNQTTGLYSSDIKQVADDFYWGLDESISKIEPSYRKLNSQISEVSTVLKDINKMLGNKNISEIDLKSLKAGEVLNRLLTNMTGNNTPIIEKFIKISQKYGGKTDIDTIRRLISNADLLEDLIPTQTRSFTAGVKKGTGQAIKEGAGDIANTLFGGTLGRLSTAAKYLDKFGDDLTTKQIKLMKELLGDTGGTTPLAKAGNMAKPTVPTPKTTTKPSVKSAKVDNLYTTLKPTTKSRITLYRGGGELLDNKITNAGISFSRSKNIAADFAKNKGGTVKEYVVNSNAKTIKYKDIPGLKYKELNDYSPILDTGDKQIWRNIEIEYQKGVEWAKKNGYDMIELPLEGETRILNKNIIKKVK